MSSLETKKVLFNRNPLTYAGKIEQPSLDTLKGTLGLWNASMEDAIKYGGELTRAALSAMNIRNDRKHVIVDTKIHMLKPGMCPAIPGWHVDGTPRGEAPNYTWHTGMPDLYAQEEMRAPRFHLLVTGEGCLTDFINEPIALDMPNKTGKMFKMMSEQLDEKKDSLNIITAPSCQVVEFDWWDIHAGVSATKSEWRYLIRVTESDFAAPQTDLRDVIRMQQQVYAPLQFGW